MNSKEYANGAIVRALADEDVAALARIEAQTFSMPWPEDAFRDLLYVPYATCVVAEYEGEVAGMICMRNLAGEGSIDNVVVAETLRGKGIASAMLEYMLEEGTLQGIEDYTLEVRVSNEKAIRLYEKFGFVCEGTRPNYYDKPKEDAYIYWKHGRD